MSCARLRDNASQDLCLDTYELNYYSVVGMAGRETWSISEIPIPVSITENMIEASVLVTFSVTDPVSVNLTVGKEIEQNLLQAALISNTGLHIWLNY